jgi:hypothetical protein
MYNFIHYFIYNQQLQKGKSDPFARANGGMVAALALCLHILLIFGILKKVLAARFSINFPVNYYGIAKLVILSILSLAYLWFKSEKRTQQIMAKLTTDKDPTRIANAFKVIIIIFLPIILLIIISQQPN